MSLCRAKFQPSKTGSLSVFNRISTGIPVANPEIVSARSFQGFSRSRSEFSFPFRASMAGGSSGEGRPLHGGAAPFRSQFDSQGLKARAVARSDEIVLQIDPEDGGLDQEVGSLRRQVHQLRNVAQEIDKEGKFQNDMLNQLQSTLIKARAGVKNNVRRLHRSIVQYGSNNVVPIIVFALICIFLVYLWYRISG